MVTGGADPSVRPPDQYVASRLVADLHGHCITVPYVAIYKQLGQILAKDTGAVLQYVNKLLNLKRQALSRRRQSRVVLVSPEGGHLRWRSVAGLRRKHTGRRAPNPPLPPLLHRWKAHDGPLVTAELLAIDTRLFLTSASVDQTVQLWRADGRYMGAFGQEREWEGSAGARVLSAPKRPWGSEAGAAEEGTGGGRLQGGEAAAEPAGSGQGPGKGSQTRAGYREEALPWDSAAGSIEKNERCHGELKPGLSHPCGKTHQ
nr:uncharacterized protein LOC111848243 [Paramormyrops kingsleyae]